MKSNLDLLKNMKIDSGTLSVLNVQKIRNYLDSQPDPLKAANDIIIKAGMQPLSNVKKAYVFAMTTIEQTMNNSTPNINEIISRANARIEKITDIIGPAAFSLNEQNHLPIPKTQSKRSIAKVIYLENIDKGEKEVIELVQKKLDVTKQNAYTYIYLIKKELKESGR